MKKFLVVMAVIFGVLTVILYFSSLNHLDSYESRLLGTSTTINIQGTVFCAACAIICALNIVGAIILNQMESLNTAARSSDSTVSSGIKTDSGIVMTAQNSWTCPKCKARNPRSRIECSECGYVR